jgi:hypothetical protein
MFLLNMLQCLLIHYSKFQFHFYYTYEYVSKLQLSKEGLLNKIHSITLISYDILITNQTQTITLNSSR